MHLNNLSKTAVETALKNHDEDLVTVHQQFLVWTK